jgi:hypothetical protein
MKKVISEMKYDELLSKAKSGTYTLTAWTVLDAAEEQVDSGDLSEGSYVVVEDAYSATVLYFNGKQLIECVREGFL